MCESKDPWPCSHSTNSPSSTSTLDISRSVRHCSWEWESWYSGALQPFSSEDFHFSWQFYESPTKGPYSGHEFLCWALCRSRSLQSIFYQFAKDDASPAVSPTQNAFSLLMRSTGRVLPDPITTRDGTEVWKWHVSITTCELIFHSNHIFQHSCRFEWILLYSIACLKFANVDILGSILVTLTAAECFYQPLLILWMSWLIGKTTSHSRRYHDVFWIWGLPEKRNQIGWPRIRWKQCWRGFREFCTASMLSRGAHSGRHSALMPAFWRLCFKRNSLTWKASWEKNNTTTKRRQVSLLFHLFLLTFLTRLWAWFTR